MTTDSMMGNNQNEISKCNVGAARSATHKATRKNDESKVMYGRHERRSVVQVDVCDIDETIFVFSWFSSCNSWSPCFPLATKRRCTRCRSWSIVARIVENAKDSDGHASTSVGGRHSSMRRRMSSRSRCRFRRSRKILE